MIKMYVASHIDVPMPILPYCSRVQAGAVNKTPWPGLRDDQGDHISQKNECYAEISILYWIWKNTADEKVGFCHYRRFFSPILFGRANQLGIKTTLAIAQSILDHDQNGRLFDTELQLSQIIVPALVNLQVSIAEDYCSAHRVSDWKAMLKALADIHPAEAKEAESYFNTPNPVHYWCMFITHRSTLDAYCQWLFPILFHLETMFTPPEDKAQMRVIGFLSERLFNWWTASRGLQMINRPIITVVPSV